MSLAPSSLLLPPKFEIWRGKKKKKESLKSKVGFNQEVMLLSFRIDEELAV